MSIRGSTASTEAKSIHDSFVAPRRKTQAPLANAVRQRATRHKRFSTEKFHPSSRSNRTQRLPVISGARSSSVPVELDTQDLDEEREQLESRMSRLTYVSGLTEAGVDAAAMPPRDATAGSPRPWREAVPSPPKRIDWGPKQLRDLVLAQEHELVNMKAALEMSIDMEDAWRKKAERGALEEEKPPGADEALAVQKMQTLLRELQKMRDQMGTLLPQPFRGQMSTTFDEISGDDGSIKGMINYLMEVFKGVQNQRGLLRKRQKQLRLIRDPIPDPKEVKKAKEEAEGALMTPAEEKEMEKRMKEADARAMCDIRFIGQIAALKQEVRTLKKNLDAARDAEKLSTRQAQTIDLLKEQVKVWEKEGQTMLERQKIFAHEAEVQRLEVENAFKERDAMREELGNAPKTIEKQQRLLGKRDERIKDLEEEAQTLRMLLKSKQRGKVETKLQVDSATGELEMSFGGAMESPAAVAAA